MSPSTWVLALSVLLFLVTVGWAARARPRLPRRSLASQIKLLGKVPVLDALTPAHLERVARVVRELIVPPNVYVIREHRAGESMFFLLSGQIDILKRGTHADTLVQRVGAGELIGEMALLTGARRIASARSLSACHLLQIDRDDFLELFGTNAEVMAAVWEACELHTLGLLMADQERTRALSPAERANWVKRRQIVVTTAGKSLTSPGSGYLGVVVGAVVLGDRLVEAPALVRVGSAERLTVQVAGRICWLPEQQSLSSAS